MNDELEQLCDRAGEQLEALETVQGRLAAIGVRETADRGRVIVGVDASGALAALELKPGAGNGDPVRLADAIVTASVRAASRAFAERAEVMEAFVADFAKLTGAASAAGAVDGVSTEPRDPQARQTSETARTEGDG